MTDPSQRKPTTAVAVAIVVALLLAFSGVHPSAWAGLLYPLMFVFYAASALALIVAPFAISGLLFYLMKRRGSDYRSATLIAIVPMATFVAWPLLGLVALVEKCEPPSVERSTTGKLGPIDSILVEGPGMWWLKDKIAVEKPAYGKAGFYRREEPRQAKGISHLQTFPESELRSRYKVTIGQPAEGTFLTQYLTAASIRIEDRTTGEMVAQLQERVWGGGLAGYYLSAVTSLNPFNVRNRHVGCGYANSEIILFRGVSRENGMLYRSADQRLIEELFILGKDN